MLEMMKMSIKKGLCNTMKIMITLTWTMGMNLIRQDDDYDEKEIIILTYISYIITFEFDQFECCYKYI